MLDAWLPTADGRYLLMSRQNAAGDGSGTTAAKTSPPVAKGAGTPEDQEWGRKLDGRYGES